MDHYWHQVYVGIGILIFPICIKAKFIEYNQYHYVIAKAGNTSHDHKNDHPTLNNKQLTTLLASLCFS